MYKHLSLEEREKLLCLHEQGISLREIGKLLGRKHTTLSRELKRNKTGFGQKSHEYFNSSYVPCIAQKKATRRAVGQRTKAPLKEPLIFLYVREHLRKPYRWTPEQISGTLPLEHPGKSITTETIYSYIYSKKAKGYKLWKLLVHQRKKRMKKGGRRIRRDGKIPGSVSIDKRPGYIDKRVQLGHWETDNVIGRSTDKTALSVTVERVTRLTIISKVKRSAGGKADSLIERLLNYPQTVRRTITADNGKENFYHQQIESGLGVKVFFCHAYHSWEKGTVENQNGRIRRYIPKGISIDTFSDEQIAAIEYRINHTPRKCLGYLTSEQKMLQLLRISSGALHP